MEHSGKVCQQNSHKIVIFMTNGTPAGVRIEVPKGPNDI
jgi:hypothetical protein